jgi:hypothetical protein
VIVYSLSAYTWSKPWCSIRSHVSSSWCNRLASIVNLKCNVVLSVVLFVDVCIVLCLFVVSCLSCLYLLFFVYVKQAFRQYRPHWTFGGGRAVCETLFTHPSSGLPLSFRRPMSDAQLVHRVAAIFRFTPTPKLSSPPRVNGSVRLSRGSSRSSPAPGRLFQPEKNRLLWGRVPPPVSPADNRTSSLSAIYMMRFVPERNLGFCFRYLGA